MKKMSRMYNKILLCLDNSEHSTTAIDFALSFAKSTGAEVTGCHVYAAKLHDSRFAEMESGLPERYQNPEELTRQRVIHDDLITKGLLTISDSYIDVLVNKAQGFGITTKSVHLEGRNFEEIVKESIRGEYDMVVLGALGLGATSKSSSGSVTRRVARMANTDVLIVRDTGFNQNSSGKIAVAIDGSPHSFGALKSAIEFSRTFSCEIEAVSAFDPVFHYTAFRSIAGVLSEEAGKIFRFKEQEKLHKEIIDDGLEKIYRRHLDTAVMVAKSEGVDIATRLFSGKATDEVMGYLSKEEPFLLVTGKTGLHATEDLDIGNLTEECLNGVNCNMLITTSTYTPTTIDTDCSTAACRPHWSLEAEEILNKIPSFARAIARNMVEQSAIKEGMDEIDADFMYEIRKRTGF